MSEEKLFLGIDVSEFQGEIDWAMVAKSGVQFVMIRATHGQKLDAMFQKHIEGAIEAGLEIGVYHCSYAKAPEDVEKDAGLFLDTIEPYRKYITYPVAFDAEQESQFRLGKEAVTNLILTFCRAVIAAGYEPVNYSNCNWLNNVIDKEALEEEGIDTWVSWPRAVRGFDPLPEDKVTKHPHTMWQFSCIGLAPGIQQNVDLNVCYVDYAAAAKQRRNDRNGVISLRDLIAELTSRGIGTIVLE